MSISLLPTRCLEYVISCLPFDQVFIVMSVSRGWQAAAHAVLRDQSHLAIDKGWGCCDPYSFLMLYNEPQEHLLVEVLRSLSCRRSLFLCPFIEELMNQNAATLCHLECVTFSPGNKVVFPRLLPLSCHLTGRNVKKIAAAMPRIQKLVLQQSTAAACAGLTDDQRGDLADV